MVAVAQSLGEGSGVGGAKGGLRWERATEEKVMPWVVGIDEAGYGPSLGPLVQAMVVWHWCQPEPLDWAALQKWIRRVGEPADGRVLIDDSKQVYTRYGWYALEEALVRTLHLQRQCWHQWLSRMALPSSVAEVMVEEWFDGQEMIPRQDYPPLQQPPFPVQARLRVLTVAAFNRQCDRCGNKAEVLAQGWTELVHSLFAANGVQRPLIATTGERVLIFSDKLGGRRYYCGLVQAGFPQAGVWPLQESARWSSYRVEQEKDAVEVHFQVEADQHNLAVALASMLAKYVREMCMAQFNRFWQQRVPELPTTSGYLPHARRWYARIAPLLRDHGLHADQVWRRR